MFNKLIRKVLFVTSVVVSLSGVANAALIKQDIISAADGVIGTITINNTPSFELGGLNEVYSWEEFSFFGIDVMPPVIPDPNQFIAQFDNNDLSAGIQFLQFDLNDVFGAFMWNGIIDVAGFGLVDVFEDANALIYFAPDVSFGQASVVPEPAAIALFMTALFGLSLRRRKV